jgi:hypothetical protein
MHSRPLHKMKVSGQFNALAALPKSIVTQYTLDRVCGSQS